MKIPNFDLIYNLGVIFPARFVFSRASKSWSQLAGFHQFWSTRAVEAVASAAAGEGEPERQVQ